MSRWVRKKWEPITDRLVMPPGARHGTVFAVTEAVLQKLLSAPPGSEPDVPASCVPEVREADVGRLWTPRG